MKFPLTFHIGILSLLSILSACSKDEPAPTTTDIDMERDFAAIDLSTPGVKDISLTVAAGVTWDFRVIIPEIADNEDYPLILALHGGSGVNANAHRNTECYVEPGLDKLKAFVISPNSEGEPWVELYNQKKLATLTLLAQNHWPIDERKIAITGYSNGGNASWFYGETQPHVFSAAIPIATSYNTYTQDSTSGRKMDIPMYVIHGEKDQLFPVDETRKWVQASLAAGSDIQLVVAPDLGHYVPCDYVPYLQQASIWLRDSVWQ